MFKYLKIIFHKLLIYFIFHLLLNCSTKGTSSNSIMTGNQSLIYSSNYSRPLVSPLKLYQDLRRHPEYKSLKWTGSGDGPFENNDESIKNGDEGGGMAWEDNSSNEDSSRDLIYITRTMVLFKTVLTTIYPIELTPTLLLSSPKITPTFSSSLITMIKSSEFDSESESQLEFSYVSPTPSFETESETFLTESSLVQSPIVPLEGSPSYSSEFETIIIQSSFSSIIAEIEPTSSVNMTSSVMLEASSTGLPTTTPFYTNDKTTESNELIPLPAQETASSNRMYWVTTIIKANGTQVLNESEYFQESMENNLARVYASAFKRHLLTSLGVLNSTVYKNNTFAQKTQRKRKRGAFFGSKGENFEELRWLYLENALKESKNLAIASLNVTVSIVNISAQNPPTVPQVSFDYVVSAEGKPVPAASAVKDMNLVSKTEMESEIGYEVINKAAALISENEGYGRRFEESGGYNGSYPWIIVAVTSISIMIVLLILLMIMVWKWKANRLESSTNNERENSTRRSMSGTHLHPTRPSRSSFNLPPPKHIEQISQDGAESSLRRVRAKSSLPRTSRNVSKTHLSDSQILLNIQKAQESHAQNLSQVLSEVDEQECKISLSASSSTSSDSLHSQRSLKSSKKSTNLEKPSQKLAQSIRNAAFDRRPISASSRDRISLGHLDICNEVEARPMSGDAKKLLRAKSGRTQKTNNQDEQGAIFVTKDAQVQTPTHVKLKTHPKRHGKPSPKRAKSSRGVKASSESLLSTESEEIIEILESSSEGNPLGRMRKRFHQFLDDAFNVMSKKDEEEEGDGDDLRSKSAKVSISHEIQTVDQFGASSKSSREEEVEKNRPGSSSVHPPKSAWTGNRRTDKKRGSSARPKSAFLKEENESEECEPDVSSSIFVSSLHDKGTDLNKSSSFLLSTSGPIFPRYPIYPDLPYPNLPNFDTDASGVSEIKMENETDPAFPLIRAINEEILKFKKVEKEFEHKKKF